MSDPTKACNLTETEIKELINHHGFSTDLSIDDRLERMNYLNKRLKAFSEVEKVEGQPTTANAAAQPATPPIEQKAW